MGQYLQMKICAPGEKEELLTMYLLEAGTLGIAVDDPSVIKQYLLSGSWDTSVFAGQKIETGRLTLRATFKAEQEAEARRLLLRFNNYEGVKAELTELPDEDWQQTWKQAFQTQEVGENLIICPYWLTDTLDDQRIPIIIEPGMAFGTGDHATTAMVLEMIEKYLLPDMNVLDLGCGSGILAIAALRLNAAAAMCIDIDPLCGPSVETHCQLNNIAPEKISFVCGDLGNDRQLYEAMIAKKYQLITANITASVISALAPAIKELLAENGILLVSGILDRFTPEIEAVFAACRLRIVEQREQGEWLAYALEHAHE